MPTSPGGAVPRDMREWDRYFRANGFQADRVGHVFTPVWDGFGTDPVGDISYYDFGVLTVLYIGADLYGLTDATNMKITNLPEALQPISGYRFITCFVGDAGQVKSGSVMLQAGSSEILFAMDDASSGDVVPNFTGWTAVGLGFKGLPGGWLIMYAK